MSASLRAACYLLVHTFVRQLRSRKTVISALLLALLLGVLFVVGIRHTWSPQDFLTVVVLNFVGFFYLPVTALMYGTGTLGDDRDEKTLVYLLVRPIPRWGTFIVKLAAVLPIVLAFTCGGLWALVGAGAAVGRPGVESLLGVSLPAVALASLAYTSLFHFLAAAFRHSTIIAVAYVFFVEVFLGHVPGILKRISVSYYSASILYGRSGDFGLDPPRLFLPLEPGEAAWLLAGFTALFAVIGAALFSVREYREDA